jgi:hypothetical protein
MEVLDDDKRSTECEDHGELSQREDS